LILLLKWDSHEIKGEKGKEVTAQEQEGGVDMDPYSMFIFAMNSHVTQRKYTGRFTRFLDFIGLKQGTVQERCETFINIARNDNKWALNNIIRFLQAQKDRVEKKEITGATLNNYVKGYEIVL
jgi:hypothetical protein